MNTYIIYLDEFGHSGPYVSRNDQHYKTSPIFGLGGIILPAHKARKFSAWFHWFKTKLFEHEINQSGIPSYHWEKKGSKLFKTKANIKYKGNNLNILKYILKNLRKNGGGIVYCGMKKYASVTDHNSNGIYLSQLKEILKRIDDFCKSNCNSNAFVILDENGGQSQRTRIVDKSAASMFGSTSLSSIIEPVLQSESHLYQNLQCADWICAILTRIFNYISSPNEYPELKWTLENNGFYTQIKYNKIIGYFKN